MATWLGAWYVAGRMDFNPIRTRTHCLHTITKLELACKRQGSRPPAPDEEPSPTTSCSLGAAQAAETRDFQGSIAENETAAMRLQGAEELEQLEAEGDSSGPGASLGSGTESLACAAHVSVYTQTHTYCIYIICTLL